MLNKPVVAFKRCSHCDPVQIGEYEVYLLSINVKIPEFLDVFIDLTGYRDFRQIPAKYQKYLKSDKTDVIIWKITDGTVDEELVDFVLSMMKDGLKVGFGCHGGHGRTGWLACRLYKEITGGSGDKAIRWIREVYCKEAVETELQYNDLGCLESHDDDDLLNWWHKGPINGLLA